MLLQSHTPAGCLGWGSLRGPQHAPGQKVLRKTQPSKNKDCAKPSEVGGGWLSREASATVATVCHGKKRNVESCKAAQHQIWSQEGQKAKSDALQWHQ